MHLPRLYPGFSLCSEKTLPGYKGARSLGREPTPRALSDRILPRRDAKLGTLCRQGKYVIVHAAHATTATNTEGKERKKQKLGKLLTEKGLLQGK